jgi:hypothetical protein
MLTGAVLQGADLAALVFGPISGLALAAATSAAALWAAGAILSVLAGTGTSLAAAPGSPEPPGKPDLAPS